MRVSAKSGNGIRRRYGVSAKMKSVNGGNKTGIAQRALAKAA
jgi:hypothetical protein